nr:serine/threonine protein kinase [Streptomyces sp.]
MTGQSDADGVTGGCARCGPAYLELLALSYNAPERQPHHQLLVDSYSVQHPGGEDPVATQRLSICLMTLYLFLERGADPQHGPQLHRRMVHRARFTRLEPHPSAQDLHKKLTAADVAAADATEYGKQLRAWAGDVWDAWREHHAQVRAWTDASLS